MGIVGERKRERERMGRSYLTASVKLSLKGVVRSGRDY